MEVLLTVTAALFAAALVGVLAWSLIGDYRNAGAVVRTILEFSEPRMTDVEKEGIKAEIVSLACVGGKRREAQAPVDRGVGPERRQHGLCALERLFEEGSVPRAEKGLKRHG